jgi:acyl-CoA synthetase (NDP forming)
VVAVALGRADGPLASAGRVPAYRFPEAAVAALGRAVGYARWRQRPSSRPAELDDVAHAEVRAVVTHALTAHPGGTLLPLGVVQDLLGVAGIAVAPAVAVTDLDGAVAAAERLGYPVALKAATRRGRTERSGIALDVGGPDELAASWARMVEALGPAMAEAVVQAMVAGGVEVGVELHAHPVLGRVVAFGLGGLFADAAGDRPARALPITAEDAAELVASSRVRVALERTGADLDAVAAVLTRVAAVADAAPELDRLVLDPVLASATGACVVDAVAHVAPAPAVDVPVRRVGPDRGRAAVAAGSGSAQA